MSKLADRIRKASRMDQAPIGFAAAAARQPLPTLLCLVRLSAHEAHKAREAANKGADAVIIEGLDARKVKEQAEKVEQLLVGVRVQKAGRQSVSSVRQAGADFAVLDLESAMADALLEENIGLVLTLNGPTEDTTLRLLGDLGLDALVVPPANGPLTVQRLLQLRRIASLARTPLLADVPGDAEASLLQALRDSGVSGLIIDSSSLGKLGDLREKILGLPPRRRKREERAEPLLPVQISAPAPPAEDEEDE